MVHWDRTGLEVIHSLFTNSDNSVLVQTFFIWKLVFVFTLIYRDNVDQAQSVVGLIHLVFCLSFDLAASRDQPLIKYETRLYISQRALQTPDSTIN
jgi:hypothetical protein